MRNLLISLIAGTALISIAAPASAQSVGIGARLAWIEADSDADQDRVRFTGGQLRLVSPRIGLELSLDRHSESFDELNQKITETPIQASLLLRLGAGGFTPYLLGGPGWYRVKVQPIEGDAETIESTEFGWHAGVGLEIRPSPRFGVHGDYRYTFLDFGDDEEDDDGFIGGLLPGHRGSMWTLGLTIYF